MLCAVVTTWYVASGKFVPPEMQCILDVDDFISKYHQLGCHEIYEYRLEADVLKDECRSPEGVRLVYSKLEMIGEDVYSTTRPCKLHRGSTHGSTHAKKKAGGEK